MEFIEAFLQSDLFKWVILPLLVFLARVTDVSINTVRVIFMLNGKKWLSTLLGFFESFIWLIVIGQIIQNVSNPITYIAYAGGFATGIYVGMLIEEKLAIGNVIVRILTQKDATDMIGNLHDFGVRMTVLDAVGNDGPVSVIFIISKRKELSQITNIVEETNPKAIFTVEGVRSVRDITEVIPEKQPLRFSFFQGVKRK